MQNISKIQTKRQGGFVLTSELIFIVTILVIGLTAGLVTVRDSLNAELEDVAEAIGSLDQSYAFDGIINGEATAAVNGSAFVDAVDLNAGDTLVFSYVAADIIEGGMTLPAGPSAGAAGPVAPGTINPVQP